MSKAEKCKTHLRRMSTYVKQVKQLEKQRRVLVRELGNTEKDTEAWLLLNNQIITNSKELNLRKDLIISEATLATEMCELEQLPEEIVLQISPPES